MSIVLRALTAPMTDITGPLYHLIQGDIKPEPYHSKYDISPQQEQLSELFLALFRTAMVAAFFFMMVVCRRFSWAQENHSRSFVFATQWLIHPYAAALFNASTHGSPLLWKVIGLFSKHQVFFTKEDVGSFFTLFAFCFVAQGLKEYTNGLDDRYSFISLVLGMKLGSPLEKAQPIFSSESKPSALMPTPQRGQPPQPTPSRPSAIPSTPTSQPGQTPQTQPEPPPPKSSAIPSTSTPQLDQQKNPPPSDAFNNVD